MVSCLAEFRSQQSRETFGTDHPVNNTSRLNLQIDEQFIVYPEQRHAKTHASLVYQFIIYDPPHEKTNTMHMRKQRRRSASR